VKKVKLGGGRTTHFVNPERNGAAGTLRTTGSRRVKVNRSRVAFAGVLSLSAVAMAFVTRPGAASPQPQIHVNDQQACLSLAAKAPADVHVTRVVVQQPGTAWAGESGAAPRQAPISVNAQFCRVQGVIAKEIGFELWLPLASAWNGKLIGAGVGGDAGVFNYQDLPRGVNRGYASATTDTGHKATDPNWMLGDPQRLINYELRANHLLAVKSKALITAFYGQAPRHSYFIGCSGGGRQGLKELQRFPDDYDGIISGAGGPKTPEMTVRRMWEILQRDAHPGLMSAADWKLVSEAGVAACDMQDRLKDGVADNPTLCRFDPGELLCRPGETKSCLNSAQVALARKIYAPLADEAGRAIDRGLLPGVLVDSGRSRLAPATFGQAIRHKADWNGEGFNVREDLAAIRRVMPELAADDPDLTSFRKRGGKVILYSGWMDGAVAARMMTEYYGEVIRHSGGLKSAERFSRLYMVPGMFHCSGGPGADMIGGSGRDGTSLDRSHDLLSALEAWVEDGQAPQTIIASKLEAGQVIRTRKICAYPQQPHYVGGDPNSARSYECTRLPGDRS
jgi:feruloyl esterase